MSRLPPNLHLGTCSWKYDDWKGLIYDPKKIYSPDDYLPDYAKHFDTVEIDQWFWSLFPGGIKLPDLPAVQTYADSVPEDFTFTVKVPNSITLTHYYAKQSARYKDFANRPNEHFLDIDLFNRFLESLKPLAGKLGPIMFQFEYLNKKKMPSLQVLLDRLSEFFDHAPPGFDYAVETRNPNYLKEVYFAFLREKGLSPVLVEGYYMPPISEVVSQFDISSGQSTVIRLMGPDRQEIEKLAGNHWDKIVSPQDESMTGIVGIIKKQVEQGREVYINVNNHYEGCAVLTIGKLLEKL